MAYYGIDLGTSQCLVARITEGFDEREFEVRCLPDRDGNESFPSVVSFVDQQEYIIGDEAAARLIDHPDSSIELIKVRLGKSKFISLNINGKEMNKSPQEITALLLRHINESRNNRIDNPVLTVPAFFDQSQKDATMQSGQLAKMIPKQLIEEPTAAVVYQIFSDYRKHGAQAFAANKRKNVLVFDFGGGTLDLSLIRLDYENGAVKPEVLAVGGDPDLGGNLIDFIFTQVTIEALSQRYPNDEFIQSVRNAFNDYFSRYCEQHILAFGPDVLPEEKHFIFRLKRELERVKINLSLTESEKIVFSRNYEPVTIRQSDFENFILQRDSLNIRDRIKTALSEIAEYGYAVNEVLLIGGSSQIPFVRKVILETFDDMGISDDAIYFSDDYMQAVAKGAAIQSALLAGMEIPPFKTNKCSSVVSRDIILKCGNESVVFVKHGTQYPFSDSKELTIRIPHALSTNVKLRLCEKIKTPSGGCQEKVICDYPYYLPLYYTGDELRLALNIDAAGLYQVEAIHVPTREKVIFEPQKAYSLSDGELLSATARMMLTSEKTK